MEMLLTIGQNITAGVCVALFALAGCIILIGKGDWLIAGYNTASKEDKAKVNIKRLRWLTAIVCWITAVFCMILPLVPNTMHVLMLTFGFVAITLLAVIFSNTWAKK